MNGSDKLLIIVIVIVLMNYLLSVASAQQPASVDAKQTLQRAIDDYSAAFETTDRDKRLNLFQRAEVQFEQAINEAEIENADLFVNLGNAALGSQRLGPAIVAYRRALQIEPTHRQALQNLQHARSLLPDWVPRPEATIGSFDSMLASVTNRTRNELLQAASIVFVVAAICLAIHIRLQRNGFRNAAIGFAIVWVGLLAVAWLEEEPTTGGMAVVTLPETIARSADSVNAPPKFSEPLPSGAEVEILEDRDQWLRVRILDGRDAWLPATSVVRLSSGDRLR